MKELISKLSSYNLFNYLLPGIIFVILSSAFTRYSFIQQDIAIGLFLYYFIGMIISRFGSLVIEPLLRRSSFIKFGAYKDFVEASRKDEKIELFSEVNNTYRTFCSLFILLLLLKLYENIESKLAGLGDWNAAILVILLLIMFIFSYRKQSGYIQKRIAANK